MKPDNEMTSEENYRQNITLVWIAAIASLVLLMVSYAPGCATMKHVVRTINDVASDACVLFGTVHPEEFTFLVKRALPNSAEGLVYPSGISVKEACAIHEVLHPFIDAQLKLQRETKASLRQSMESPNAVSP